MIKIIGVISDSESLCVISRHLRAMSEKCGAVSLTTPILLWNCHILA